ncbi:TnpV protein [Eisenbergiella tayi]|uniref:TnpV protein n=2 Tax=Eisenbergiella porci TaxID=2652274 RepID=A0A6N7WIF4_9FIRM|nr:TnpV protein [Eisenbergiella porci]
MSKLTYTNRNGYLIPNLMMDSKPEEPETLTRFGRAREKYLMEHRKGTYTAMLLKGTLWTHLTEIDRTANEQIDSLTRELAASEGVTEALKASNQMEWVQRMNNIRQRAEEIVTADLIYS